MNPHRLHHRATFIFGLFAVALVLAVVIVGLHALADFTATFEQQVQR